MILLGYYISTLLHLSSQMECKGKSSGVNTKKSTQLLWLCLPSSSLFGSLFRGTAWINLLGSILYTKGNSATGQASEEFTMPLCFKAFIKSNIFLLICGIFAFFFRSTFIFTLTSQEQIRLHSRARKRYRRPFMSHLKPFFQGLSVIFYTEINFILQ